MKFSKFLACCCCLLFSVSLSFAHEGSEKNKEARACLKEAKSAANTCEKSCKADFREAAGMCTSLNPDCIRGCRTAFKACVMPINEQHEVCKDGCGTALDSARQACRTQCVCEKGKCLKDSCFRACINPALVTSFQCNLTCRDNFLLSSELQGALTACKNTRNECFKGCKNPSPSPTASATPASN